MEDKEQPEAKAFLEGTLMRVDLNQNALEALKLRLPTGGEAGANSLFMPG